LNAHRVFTYLHFANTRFRDKPALEKVPVNDRKGDTSGTWLETFDLLLTALARMALCRAEQRCP
jgi:hypothetical protein